MANKICFNLKTKQAFFFHNILILSYSNQFTQFIYIYNNSLVKVFDKVNYKNVFMSFSVSENFTHFLATTYLA